MARTGLGPWKLVPAKGSSSHPGWIMLKITCRDHAHSSSQPRLMSRQSSSHLSSTVYSSENSVDSDQQASKDAS